MSEVMNVGKLCMPDHWFSSDDRFDHIFPRDIQLLTKRHWTPLRITRSVLDFLVPHSGVKVLDIGSGVGKFCLTAAHYRPQASFFGVEQRKRLTDHAEHAKMILQLKNVHFFPMNMMDLDFKRFDHFYFYNSFYENLFDTQKIDDSVKVDPALYNYYTCRLREKLGKMPAGTRLVTFHCLDGGPPARYELVEESEDGLLKFWIKA